MGTLIHGVSRTIDWLVVGRLAAGSVPATAVTLLALSMLDFDNAEARRAITITLAGVLGLTSMALFFSKQILPWHANYVRELDPKSVSLFTIALGALVVTGTMADEAYGQISGTLITVYFEWLAVKNEPIH
jgi:hypothetical protein